MRQVEELDDSEEDKLAVPLAVVEEVRRIKGSYLPPLKVVKLDTQDCGWSWILGLLCQ